MPRQRVLRWTVPIDDRVHLLYAEGTVVRIEVDRIYDCVDVWTYPEPEPAGPTPKGRSFRIFGTGQPIPAGYTYRGTAARTAAGLVWHLFELVDP